MRRLRMVSVVLLAAGAVVLAAAAVRIGLLWVIDPFGGALVPAGALLLAAGLVAGAGSLPALRGRPLRSAAALAAVALLLLGAARALSAAAAQDTTGRAFVPYGPGAPPSISWSLLTAQVALPTLASVAVLLAAAALLAGILGTARSVSARLRTV